MRGRDAFPALAAEMASDIVKGIDDRFAARRPEGGRMPVVMGAGASGILLHEAMGHAFEADFNRKGTSIFADKMGARICPEGINIIVKPTGNGRRESFRYAPIPRMRATYMESGTAKAADLIAEVSKGIFVDEFSNGQVQIGEGDFTFYVKSGYMIENGRLTMPVKDINIIGNGPAALADIRGVADDLVVDPGAWTCGKEQSVPVSCGIPTVLIGNLTVGGQ